MIKLFEQWVKQQGVADLTVLAPSEVAALTTHFLHDGTPDSAYLSNSFISDKSEFYRKVCEMPDELKRLVEHPIYPSVSEQESRFKFIDLFAGVGGFRLALNAQQGRCVFSSEWDRAAKETYFKNFGEIPFGDIRQFTGEDSENYLVDSLIPDHDVLAAGFPCQPFSRAGGSARSALKIEHGFNCSTQGNLFFDFL